MLSSLVLVSIAARILSDISPIPLESLRPCNLRGTVNIFIGKEASYPL